MSLPRGGLDRVLTALTIGVQQGAQQRKLALSDTRTGEKTQQVHVSLSGAAGDGWGYMDQQVAWEQPFLYAPLQRDVPFLTPHFAHSIEMTAGTGSLVVIHAQVIDWAVTDAQWYVGATLRFASTSPGAASPVPYSAVAHCSFQGFATLSEFDEFDR